MATKPQVKVAPERMGLTKVWNISDWPQTDIKMQTVMVLGTTVPPGRCVEVKEADLKKAHKTMKDRDAGLVYIGAQPPQAYLDAMGRRKRLKLPKGAARSRGPTDGAKPGSKKAEKVTTSSRPAEEKKVEEAKPSAPMSEGTSVFGSDKKKRK